MAKIAPNHHRMRNTRASVIELRRSLLASDIPRKTINNNGIWLLQYLTIQIFTDFDPKTAKSGNILPLARKLRTAMFADGVVPSQVFTQLAVNVWVYAASDVTSFQDTSNCEILNIILFNFNDTCDYLQLNRNITNNRTSH